MRINNRDAREYVKARKPFMGSNLYGVTTQTGEFRQYVVYSYNTPMYVYEDGEEFVNKERYSVTTSKHMTQIGVRNRGIPLDGREMSMLTLLGARLFKKRSVEKALS